MNVPETRATIVFDLDGTLVDTAPDLHAALNHTLSRFEYETVELSVVHSVIGAGAKAMIKRALNASNKELSPEQLDDMFDVFLDFYMDHSSDLSRPFPGILDCLSKLKADGYRLAVCTNKLQRLTDPVLDGLKLTQYFNAVVGADTARNKKPSPDHIEDAINAASGSVSNAVMIGDSSPDALSANALGIPFIFMKYGYPDSDLDEGLCQVILDRADKLYDAILSCITSP